jgi:hypothetical protein
MNNLHSKPVSKIFIKTFLLVRIYSKGALEWGLGKAFGHTRAYEDIQETGGKSGFINQGRWNGCGVQKASDERGIHTNL